MTSDSQTTAAPPVEQPIDDATARRNTLVISLLLVSAFVVILNETIMGVALPHLMTDLQITASAAQWLTTAFMLTMAVVIPITGFLLQRFTTRAVFMFAMTAFSTGTLISAISPGFEVLLLGRVVQAVGTATMMPLLMTTVMNLVPAASRGRVMGNISIVISVAPAIGPTISGIILNILDWRWMFWLVLPIAVASLLLGMARIKNVSTPRPAPFDVLSVILSAFAFGGLVYGLSSLGEAASHPGPVPGWLPIAIGAFALVLFVWRQLALQREDKALLDLRTFLSRVFTVSVVMMAISMMALFGTIILLPIYIQNVLGLDALQTGLLLLPGGLIMGLIAPFVGRLYDRFGPGPLIIPGSILVSAVLWGMTLLGQHTSQYWLLAAHVTLSIGLALMFTPLFTASLGSLPRHLYSHGSAVIGTAQQLAGAAGTALFVAVMSMTAGRLAASGVDQVAATAEGIHTAFIWGAVISMFAIVAAFFVRKPETEDVPEGAVAGH
ncbi:MFS transporter [Youhaiella tibetensis]|uniref:Multidrug efflux MFS transporter n=1 Tax=Paradevosia tibetensis TaxID=1447062 RepID=A0A5B9DR50_9HYPH|nr:MDR family MFS transporter [Youhaiella tibetensis]QEE21623.1 multidrug efflux MFS transporter [Youhaiella tibetensis]GGF13173.1 MFS transporter [Youhaiella tibetensis]